MNRTLAAHHLARMYGAVQSNMPVKKRVVHEKIESNDIVQDVIARLEQYGVVNIDDESVDQIAHRNQSQSLLDAAYSIRKKLGVTGDIEYTELTKPRTAAHLNN